MNEALHVNNGQPKFSDGELMARVDDLQSQNAALIRRVSELEVARAGVVQSRIAALNLLEDAVAARRDLQKEVNERRRSEEALSHSEERFRRLVEAYAQAVWESDPRGMVAVDSPSWRTFTGQSLEEWRGLGWLDAIHPEDHERVERLWSDAIIAQRNFDVECRLRHAAGGWRWTNIRSAPIFAADGTVVKWTGMNIDIHARKLAEEALKTSEEQLRHRELELTQVQLIGGVGGINIDISNGLTGRRSPEYLRLHGLPANTSEERHEDWLSRLHPEDRERAEKTLYKALEGRSVNYESEYRIIRPSDGQQRWIFAKANIERDMEGRCLRLIGAHIDITERKLAEQQVADDLRATELLRELGAQLPADKDADVFYQHVVTVAKELTHAQAGTVQMLDEETEELVMVAAQGFGPEVQEYFFRVASQSHSSCGRALASKERTFVDFDVPPEEDPKGEMRMHRESGYLSAQSTPLVTRAGKTVGMVSTHWVEKRRPTEREMRFLDILARQVADMIERRKTQEALRRSEEKYRTLFESIDEGFCLIDVLFDEEGRPVDYRFVETNPAFAKHTGIENAIGRTMLEIEPRLEKQWFEIYGEVAMTGEPRRFELRAHALGRDFDVYAFRSGISGENRIAIVFTDISERVRTQALLRTSEQHLAAFFAKAEVGISEVSASGRFLRVNDTLCRILQRPREELMTLGVPDVTYGEDLPASFEGIRKLLKSGESISLDKRYVRPDGSLIWANSALSLLDHGNDGLTILAVTADITERRLAEETMKSALEAAEHAHSESEAASRAKDHFLAVLSHELRTPLTPVTMIAEQLLKDPTVPPSVREDLEVVHRNVQVECRLIDDLLDLSRVVHGKFEVKHADVDLHDVVKEVLAMITPEISAKKQTLNLELSASESRVCGDSIRLQQVVWNLLKNAVKFTGKEGTITIRTCNESDQIVTEVHDTGIGMNPENLQRIFEAFTQGSHEITKRYGGLGLGLAISKATLEAHHSSLHASSPGIGFGSTFVFRLPLALRVNLIQ